MRLVEQGILVALGLAIACAVPTTAAALEPFEFALIGDYPYFPRETAGLPRLVRDIAAAKEIRFVIHLGDIHNPRSDTRCSDELYLSRRESLLGLGHPFVLTPGDNDWADCRDRARTTYEHLEALRRVFHADPTRSNGPRPFSLRPQSAGDDFPEVVENAMWQHEGVVFATLHLIVPSPLSFLDSDTGRHTERLVSAGEAWLDATFAFARKRNARAVFLAMQGNLWPVSGLPIMLRRMAPELLEGHALFGPFKAKLADHVRGFRRPVALANGDTHYFRVDKPLFDQDLEMLETFTRVEGFGSPHGHWVRVRVEPNRPEVFSFRQEIVEENVFTLVPPGERTREGADPGLGAVGLMIGGFHILRPYLTLLGALTLAYWIARGIRRLLRLARP